MLFLATGAVVKSILPTDSREEGDGPFFMRMDHGASFRGAADYAERVTQSFFRPFGFGIGRTAERERRFTSGDPRFGHEEDVVTPWRSIGNCRGCRKVVRQRGGHEFDADHLSDSDEGVLGHRFDHAGIFLCA